MNANVGLLWDPVERSYYRLSSRPDGRGERTYIRSSTSSVPPRTSSSNPLALPLGATIHSSGGPRPAQPPPHPLEPYGSQRPTPGGNPRPLPGPSPLPSSPYAPQHKELYGTSTQYGYATAGAPSGLGRGMSGLSLTGSRPDTQRTASTRTAIAPGIERRASAMPSDRQPVSNAGIQPIRGSTGATMGQTTTIPASSRQPMQQGIPVDTTGTNVSGSRKQRAYTLTSNLASATSCASQGMPTAYDSRPGQTTSYTTALSTPGYTSQALGSPYLTTPTPAASLAAPQKLPIHAPAPGLGVSTTAPGQVAVGYHTRSGGQGSTKDKHGPKDPAANNQYRRRSSNIDETVVDDISQILLRGTAGQAERLDPNYRVSRDHWAFFVPGRVFKVLSWEPQGSSPFSGVSVTSVQKYGETAFAKIYRYVVVCARPQQGYSVCLRISTYGDQGTAKGFVDQSEHSIIYTGDVAPEKLPEEKKLTKDPIQVVPVPGHYLKDLSRVNCAKSYPVEHNVKVLEVGKVAKNHIRTLVAYWQNETKNSFSKTRSKRKTGSSKDQKTASGPRKRS